MFSVCVCSWLVPFWPHVVLRSFNYAERFDAVNFHHDTDRLSDGLCVGVYVSGSVYELVQTDRYNRACWR